MNTTFIKNDLITLYHSNFGIQTLEIMFYAIDIFSFGMNCYLGKLFGFKGQWLERENETDIYS